MIEKQWTDLNSKCSVLVSPSLSSWNLLRLWAVVICRMESSKGSYAKEWVTWEKQLRETLLSNSEYLNSIQVMFCTGSLWTRILGYLISLEFPPSKGCLSVMTMPSTLVSTVKRPLNSSLMENSTNLITCCRM